MADVIELESSYQILYMQMFLMKRIKPHRWSLTSDKAIDKGLKGAGEK